MKVKKSNIKFEDLPDTITPEIYSDWRGIGIVKARERFHSLNFPLIKIVELILLQIKEQYLFMSFVQMMKLKKYYLKK